jgi:hypothetical protein
VDHRSRATHLALLAVLSTVAPLTAAAAVPSLEHVIVVVMENKAYAQASAPPYTASLMASGSSFSSFYAYTHPSQPNYLMLWSGSTQGVTNDACPAAGSPYASDNLGQACEAAGKTWRTYAEDLPSPGSAVCTNNGTLYLRRHCPWTYFSNLDHNNERLYTDLATDIANSTLPNLAFVIPNNHDNTHDSGYDVYFGDAWLAANVPAMIDAVGPYGVVILTWDEDDGHAGNRVLTVFKGPLVKSGYQSTALTYHWNMVRTICDALGIARPGLAASALPIEDIWLAGLVGVSPGPGGGVSLSAPSPNPSTGAVASRLSLSQPVTVDAGIYDLDGRAVRRLASGRHSGGLDLRWDGRHEDGRRAGAGVYMLIVRAGDRILRRKAVLFR